jgi:hypothetical protein
VAWLPFETRPWSPVAIAGVILALTTWSWRRSSLTETRYLGVVVVGLITLVCSGASGWDPARAVGEIGMGASLIGLIWLASRSRPPELFPTLLALGLTGLAVWGIWQVVAGFESVAPMLDQLPESSRAYAEERVASRRAFASLPLPSHLAVMLATALPLLVTQVRATGFGVAAGFGAVVAVLGLAATRSPVGIGLALLAVAAVVVGKYGRTATAVLGVLAAALITVVALRPDVTRLEPVALRIDNWRTALWLSGSSPASGVGLSSFAQAGQRMPLVVGNRPAHAHSLPLEVLAELGPVGLAGFALAAVGLVGMLVVLWRRDRALAAALAVIPLHNLVDFSFFVSGVAVPWAVLLGWGLARREAKAPAAQHRFGRLAVVIAVSAAMAGTVLHATSILVEESAAAEPDLTVRFEGARQALRLAPWRVEPQFLLAAAALGAEDTVMRQQAWDELESHRWWRPRSAALAERRARVALALGNVSVAAAELWAVRDGTLSDGGGRHALDELLLALEGDDLDPSG